jgi:hypothetical protein
MDSGQYERVKQLFEVCRVLPQAERATHLGSEAAGDAEVEHEVRALLEAYDRSANFLEQPVLELQAQILERAIRHSGKPAPELAAGTRIGHYQIAAPIGAGGMGIVYRARDTRLDRTVAIKILPAQFSSDPIRKQRFDREAKTIGSAVAPLLERSRTR